MTEDLGRGSDAREDTERETSDSDILSGAEGAEALVGQAEILVAQPGPGEAITIAAEAGQRYVIDFDPEAAQVRVAGDDLILIFPDGGRIVFADLGQAVQAADAPVFEIAGTPIPGATLFAQAVAMSEAAPVTFETAAAPAGPIGTGETRYSDDTGQVIDLLNPLGVIPPTELVFRLIDLEVIKNIFEGPPSALLAPLPPSPPLNPPEDFDASR
ncbi:MAG: hypothetical protein ACE5GS_14275, partial [Kiloniellaceae bacterium]